MPQLVNYAEKTGLVYFKYNKFIDREGRWQQTGDIMVDLYDDRQAKVITKLEGGIYVITYDEYDDDKLRAVNCVVVSEVETNLRF